MSNLAPTASSSFSQSAVSALTGVQGLIRSTLKLLAEDTRSVSRTTRETAGLLVAAWALLLVGGILVALAIAFAMQELLPVVPLFAWLALVGVPLMLYGYVLFCGGRVKLDALAPLHQSSSQLLAEAGVVAAQVNTAIESAKTGIHDSTGFVAAKVEAVRNAADLHHQVDQRPWVMLSAAIGLGYAGGLCIHAATAQSGEAGHAPRGCVDGVNGLASSPASREEPGAFSKLGLLFAPQLELLREVAIAALLNAARNFADDMAAKPASRPEQKESDAPQSNTTSTSSWKERAP